MGSLERRIDLDKKTEAFGKSPFFSILEDREVIVDEADKWSEEFLEVFEASEGDEFRDYVKMRGGRDYCAAVGEGEE